MKENGRLHFRGGRRLHRADQKTMRRHNLSLVLNCVINAPKSTRAEVSAETGLNPSTVSSLTSELIERGLIREFGTTQSGAVGRPGRALELNPDGGAAIGIELNDDGYGLVALDLSGGVRYRAYVNQDNQDVDPESVIGRIVELSNEALAQFDRQTSQAVCTMAVPGLINPNTDTVTAPNIGWEGIPVKKLWSEVGGLNSLALENEARLAAYAEMSEGLGRSLGDFAYISGGVGIGSGIVLDRQIYRGTHGFAGEFGHLVVNYSETELVTVQMLAGEAQIAKLANIPVKPRPNGDDHEWLSRQIAERAAAGDADVLRALQQAGRALGIGIGNLLHLFDVEAVVLGGFLTHLETWLRGPIEEAITNNLYSGIMSAAPVHFSNLGRQAAVRGAAISSLNNLLEYASSE